MGERATNASVRFHPYPYRAVVQYGQPPPVVHSRVTSPPAPCLEVIPPTFPVITDQAVAAGKAVQDSDDRGLYWKHFRPGLPMLLAISTMLGGLCMLLLQIPILCRFTSMPKTESSIGIGSLCCLVLGCIIYSTFVDPGTTTDQGLPRSHKTWLYGKKCPVRRFDHYEQWIQNVVGLSNHREFIVMLCGLTLIAAIGSITDVLVVILITKTAETGVMWREIIILAHFTYSLFLLVQSGRSLKIHAGLISHSELNQDLKRNKYRIEEDDLEEGMCDEIFTGNSLVYDTSRNPFDQGCFTNCWNFWCQPRWCVEATGDF